MPRKKPTLSEADASSINALHAAKTDTQIDTTDESQFNLHDVQTLSDLERVGESQKGGIAKGDILLIK